MQTASEAVQSGLMTVFIGRQSKLNLAMLAARKWCTEKLKLNEPIECEIANHLNGQCKVIGGNKEALDFIELNMKEFNIAKIKRLPVSGAFHTSLMRPAEDAVRYVLKEVCIKKPLIRVHFNFDSKPHYFPDKIKYLLAKQISNPVKWEQTLNEMYYNVNLPIDDELASMGPADVEINEADGSKSKKILQTQDRTYPDIYECGPARHTGPILKTINHKAFQYYKYIGV